MILYHAITTYQLLYCMVHRMKFNSETESHIVVPSFIKNKFSNYKELHGNYFDYLIEYDAEKMNPFVNREKFLDNINGNFDKLVNLKKYEAIYVAGAQSFMGIYLVNQGRHFNYIEEGSGLMSQPEVVEEIVENIFPEHNKLYKEYGLYTGDNEFVLSKLVNEKAQAHGYSKDKVIHFDVTEEINALPKENLLMILKFFGVEEQIELRDDSLVILTQHFSNLRVLTYHEQINLYKIVVDYFVSKYTLVFKPHPDDILPYETIFNNSQVIKTKFPSELFSLVFSRQPKAIMTVTSTAINNLRTQFKSCYEFDYKFEKNFEDIHRYYSILKIFSNLELKKNYYEMNTSKYLLTNLIELSDANMDIEINSVDKLDSLKENSIIFVDDYCDNILEESNRVCGFLEQVDDSSIVIFLNSNKEFLFFDTQRKDIFKHIAPVVIDVIELNNEGNPIKRSDTVYIYSKRSEVRRMITEVKLEKTLHYSQKSVQVEPKSQENLELLVVKGILEATEKRLQHYIKLEKELREELNKKGR